MQYREGVKSHERKSSGRTKEKKKRTDLLGEGIQIQSAFADVPSGSYFLLCHQLYAPSLGIYVAFVKYNYRDGIFGSKFIGFKNFEFLFTSGKLWTLTKNTILYNIAFIILGNVLAVFVAILLNESAANGSRRFLRRSCSSRISFHRSW